jgi:15-cis-phytoene synthase
MNELDRSYTHCKHVTRTRARNFYYSFILLDKTRHDSMCAAYAFMRESDDLSDDPNRDGPGAARRALDNWREGLHRALAGNFDGHPVWPAFYDTVRRYGIPNAYFDHLLDGMASDLEPRRIVTFDELYRYCYQVASVPGLTTIHILGFKSPEALPLAEKCGVAFQLTNILRDVREDAERGRVYLPAEDLDRFGVDASGFQEGRGGANFRALMEFEANRARDYYRESAPLLKATEGASRRSLWALIEIYSRLLKRIRERDYAVLDRRVHLSSLEKAAILVQAFLGLSG